MTMLDSRFAAVEFRVSEWAHWAGGRKGIGPAPVKCRSMESHALADAGEVWGDDDLWEEPDADDDRAMAVELALRKIPTACRAVIEAAYLRYRTHDGGTLGTALEALAKVLGVRC